MRELLPRGRPAESLKRSLLAAPKLVAPLEAVHARGAGMSEFEPVAECADVGRGSLQERGSSAGPREISATGDGQPEEAWQLFSRGGVVLGLGPADAEREREHGANCRCSCTCSSGGIR